MKNRAFFLASMFLVVVASGLHFGALTQIQYGLLQRARSVTAAAELKQQMRADADRSFDRGSVFGSIGLCFVVGSVVCLVVSFRRRESARRSIPITMLVVYVMLQFFVV